MKFIDADNDSPIIAGLNGSIDEDRCTLRWHWPAGVQSVYIRKMDADAGVEEPESPTGLRLYTKDEYKANNGYHDRVTGIGRILYTVYACVMEDGEQLLIRQQDGSNRTAVSTGKAKIRYAVRMKGGLFKKYKTVHIQVTTEVPLSKEVLCYVKKQGGYPINRDDGTVYPFVVDFAPGQNVLPAIEIGKEEYVRLFFTDGPRYGHLYELIPE
ncbi:beta-mannanase [Paenibacillus marinisediminis]